eukprot:COSAG06_NODE_7037_length_2663_cov_1.815984_1_plen_83_part_00
MFCLLFQCAKHVIEPRQARDKRSVSSETHRVCVYIIIYIMHAGVVIIDEFNRLLGAENATLFLRFPYVCPEPVLAKGSFLYI